MKFSEGEFAAFIQQVPMAESFLKDEKPVAMSRDMLENVKTC